MAGLVGAGRSEFAETLFGIRPKISGHIYLNGKLGHIRQPIDAIALGIALVPEDRRNHGLILAESISGNIALPNLDTLQIAKILNFGRIRSTALKGVSSLKIRTTGIAKQAGQLSGGNQQKVVLYKWLHRQPTLLILDEPTRGVDVGAKKEIYDLMHELTEKGVGILMISSDLEEVINLSDRVVVMHENQKTGELSREQLSEESIMRLATGAKS
jgi:ribose transport system ATP-binding protein